MTAFTATATVTDSRTGLSATGTGGFAVASTVARFTGAICSPPNACPSNVNTWLQMQASTFGGQLGGNKMFYSGTQGMSTWAAGHLKTDNESLLPSDILVVICYGDAQIPSLPKYVESIPDTQAEVWMVYHQEAEDNYPNGDYATFKATTQRCSQAIRAVGRPNVKVVQDCAGSKYGVAGSTAEQGLWAVDPEFIDIYSIDCYQNQPAGKWPTKGLANFPEFQNWLKIYAPLGPLAVTEYGVSSCNGAAARNARIQEDCATLRSLFVGGPGAVSPHPLQCWLYWYSNCQADTLTTDCQHSHQFVDAATIATWTSACAGTI